MDELIMKIKSATLKKLIQSYIRNLIMEHTDLDVPVILNTFETDIRDGVIHIHADVEASCKVEDAADKASRVLLGAPIHKI